ncbi:hypothetical protein PFISCL1PPCAC_12479, partial [Pristionchus fissidentatus]
LSIGPPTTSETAEADSTVRVKPEIPENPFIASTSPPKNSHPINASIVTSNAKSIKAEPYSEDLNIVKRRSEIMKSKPEIPENPSMAPPPPSLHLARASSSTASIVTYNVISIKEEPYSEELSVEERRDNIQKKLRCALGLAGKESEVDQSSSAKRKCIEPPRGTSIHSSASKWS